MAAGDDIGEVMGIDPSLSGTGLADDHGRVRVIRTAGMEPIPRLHMIRNVVLDTVTRSTTHVAIEGYAFGAPYSAHALGELGGVLRYTLWRLGLSWWDIAPTSLKKFATGNGKAKKEQVVANARERLGYGGYDADEADALWLRAAGRELIGRPLLRLPKSHTDALRAQVARGPNRGMRSVRTTDVKTQGQLL